MSTDPSDRSPRPRSANRQRPSSHDHIGERLRADTETRYIFRAAWKTSRLLMIFGVDIASNKISALYFRPIFQPPQTP